MLLPLQGVSPLLFFTQGDALCYVQTLPFQGACWRDADNHIKHFNFNYSYENLF